MLNSVKDSIRGPVQSCRISFNPSSYFVDIYILLLHTFLLSVIDKGIKELSVVNRGIGCYELPSETFFCPTLEKLELDRCMLSILLPPATFSHQSNIKSLIPFGVHFTNDQQMISCCRLLESLKVDSCIIVRHFRICSPKLSSLEISTLKPMRNSLKDVAQLRQATFRFQFTHEHTCIRVMIPAEKKMTIKLKSLFSCSWITPLVIWRGFLYISARVLLSAFNGREQLFLLACHHNTT